MIGIDYNLMERCAADLLQVQLPEISDSNDGCNERRTATSDEAVLARVGRSRVSWGNIDRWRDEWILARRCSSLTTR
jgi:hypothetical protein